MNFPQKIIEKLKIKKYKAIIMALTNNFFHSFSENKFELMII